MLYLFLSIPFLAPECPHQVTEICSAKGFYKKLQMTHRRAKSRFVFRPRALSDTVYPSISSLARAEAPVDDKWCLDPRWGWARRGPGRTLSRPSPQSECRAARGQPGAGTARSGTRDQQHAFIFHPTNILVTVRRHCSSCWGYSCEQNRQNKSLQPGARRGVGRQMINT